MDPTYADARLDSLEAKMETLEQRIPDSNIVSPSFWKRVFTVFGYNLVIYLVVLLPLTFVLGILAAIAIPKFASTKELAYAAAMKSDLRNLVTAEEIYFADNFSYTSDLAALRYTATTGVTGPTVVLTSDGWTASVGHTAVSNTCVIFVGSTSIQPATYSGEPRCTDSR